MEQQTQTLLQGMPWVPSTQTDVQETWRKHGWAPINPTPAPGAGVTYTLNRPQYTGDEHGS